MITSMYIHAVVFCHFLWDIDIQEVKPEAREFILCFGHDSS